jgi:hypothetical protein
VYNKSNNSLLEEHILKVYFREIIYCTPAFTVFYLLVYVCGVQKSLLYISKMALMFRQKLLLLSRRN